MPNCFQLFRKSEPGVAVKFTTVDEEMCEHFNVPCDEKKWHFHWMDVVGFGIACGQTLAMQIKSLYREYGSPPYTDETIQHQLDILKWLDENFTSDAWAEIGRK